MARQLTRLPVGNQEALLATIRRDDLSVLEVKRVVDLLLGCATREQIEFVLLKPRQKDDLVLWDKDEFGFDKLQREDNPRAPSLFYKVIDSRTRQRSTALISNVDFDAWDTYLGDAPMAMAMAMLDRVVDGAILHKFQGKSYRAHRARRPSAGKPSKDQRDAAR